MDLHDRETCLKVFSIHLKNAEITLAKEDFLQADEQLSKAIELLDDTHLFEKGKKLRQRGEIRFKKGEILNAEDDLQESVATFEAVLKQAEARRWTIRKRYFCSLLSLFCSSMTKEELDRNRDSELT